MATEETLIRLLDKLSLRQDKIECLLEAKLLLSTISIAHLKNIWFNFDSLFECLESTDVKQIELTCEVLEKLLIYSDSKKVMENLNNKIMTGLTHSSPIVQELCLKQISIVTKKEVNLILKYQNVILSTISLLSKDNISLANLASNILTSIASSSNGLQYLLTNNQVTTLLLDISKMNEVNSCRVNEILVKIICSNKESIQLLDFYESLLISNLFLDLKSSDLLLQLNCFENIQQLAAHKHSLMWLQKMGIISKLEVLRIQCENNELTFLLMPSLITIFGKLCNMYPYEMPSRFKEFIESIFRNMRDLTSSLLLITMQTIGFIATNSEGKLVLQRHFANEMKSCCQTLEQIYKNSTQELRVISMETIKEFFYLQSEDQTEELLQITQIWFNHLSTSFLSNLINTSRNPIIELKCGSFSILQALANMPWSQVKLSQVPGFIEYLLDRSSERTKEGIIARYSIVQTLLASPSINSIFGDSVFRQLDIYAKQGEFYSQFQTASVIMDETS